MIYQCSGCNQDKDDDTDIGTLIGEDYYCEGCLAEHQHKIDYVNELEWMVKFMDEVEPAIRNAVLDESIEAVKYLLPTSFSLTDMRSTLNEASKSIEKLKWERNERHDDKTTGNKRNV